MAQVNASQNLGLYIYENQNSVRPTQFAVELAYAPPSTKDVANGQQAMLVATSAGSTNVTTNTSQAVLLAAYKDTAPGIARQQAWSFVLDGHRFYVLPLGEEGDWAYDPTTKEWSQLQTQGFEGLNFTRGVMWGIRIIGGDQLFPFLLEMDPNQPLDDEWRAVQHIVTGGIATRSRANIGVGNFSIVASVNDVAEAGKTINLSWSDDNGSTWSAEQPITLTGEASQFLIWNSLGSFTIPGRIFRISDEAGPVRLDGADVVLNYSNGADSGTDQDR